MGIGWEEIWCYKKDTVQGGKKSHIQKTNLYSVITQVADDIVI